MPADIQQIDEALQGARIAGALPYLNHEMERSMKAVQVRAFQSIEKSSLTPDMAFMLWHELHALYKMQRKLMQRAAITESLDPELQKALETSGQ